MRMSVQRCTYSREGFKLPVNVTVDIRKEFGEFNSQSLEAITQLVKFLDDDRRAGQVAAAHALAEVPHRDTGRLQITDLRNTIFAIVYQRLEAPRNAGDLYEVRDGAPVSRLEQCACC